jgi:ABC-type dipeptide/oligopeptide/nickel transport system permease subunit
MIAIAWKSLYWAIKKCVLFIVLVVTMVAIICLPSAILPALHPPLEQVEVVARTYLKAVEVQLVGLSHGQYIVTEQEMQRFPPGSPQRKFIDNQQQSMKQQLPVTLLLVFAALAASLVLGAGLGMAISRYGSPWLRWPLWGATTALAAAPDILLAVAVDLGLYFFGRATGWQWTVHPAAGPLPFRNYISPWLCLTLLALPLFARTTAVALDETAGQIYVRTAMAKGLRPYQVLGKHVGRNALIRVWSVMPIAAGALLGSVPLVEYMTSTPGLGLTMVRNIDKRSVIIYDLVPFVAAFMVLAMLFDLGQWLLDPRQTTGESTVAQGGPNRWRKWVTNARDLGRSLAGLPARLKRLPADLFYTGWDVVAGIPRTLVNVLRTLLDPVMLLGLLLVAALVTVAILAPKLAPHDPDWRYQAYQDAAGHVWSPPMPPHAGFLFGTDDMGRDMLSRLIYGTRTALYLALFITPLRFGAATLLGLLAARGRGLSFTVVRWLSTAFAALPAILLPLTAIPFVNLNFQHSISNRAVWLAAAFVAVPGVPRLADAVRRQVCETLQQPYLEGAQAVGAGNGRILLRYILPELAPQLVTLFALEIPAVLVTTFTLGYFKVYIGGARWGQPVAVGVYENLGPILPEWGASLQAWPAGVLLSGKWWLTTPLLALTVAVAGFLLVAEGLRRHWRSRSGWQ